MTLERGAATLVRHQHLRHLHVETVLATDPAASYADTLPSTGCYQYRLTATDQVGNTFTTADRRHRHQRRALRDTGSRTPPAW